MSLRGGYNHVFTAPVFAISVVLALLSHRAIGQEISAEVEVPGSQFLIGEHIPLIIRVTADKNIVLQWPETGDTLPVALSVLHIAPIDTLRGDDGMYTYAQKITVTAFDSGTYTVNPITLRYSNTGSSFIKEAFTPPLLITFSLAEVSEDEEIRDIKAPFSFPVTFRELLPWMLGVAALITLIILVIKFLRRRKRRQHTFLTMAESLPSESREPWQVALDALERLEVPKAGQEASWYYEAVSGIVREYLRDGLGVNAPELTTRQVMRRMSSRNDVTGKCNNTLSRVLQVSDLVKFARHIPSVSQHHALMEDARRFVSDTAPAFVAEPTENQQGEKP